jgi:hypothetical protein
MLILWGFLTVDCTKNVEVKMCTKINTEFGNFESHKFSLTTT